MQKITDPRIRDAIRHLYTLLIQGSYTTIIEMGAFGRGDIHVTDEYLHAYSLDLEMPPDSIFDELERARTLAVPDTKTDKAAYLVDVPIWYDGQAGDVFAQFHVIERQNDSFWVTLNTILL